MRSFIVGLALLSANLLLEMTAYHQAFASGIYVPPAPPVASPEKCKANPSLPGCKAQK